MEKVHETTPSPQPPTNTDPTLNTTANDGVPRTWQHPDKLPLRPAPEINPNFLPTTRPLKAPMTRANWVNAFWADISGQLRRLSVISSALFDGLLLRRETATGSLILRELRNTYEQLGNDRTLATVRVLSPENPMRGMWQLLWTIKRERDPNGRQFHSQTTIDPIDNECHLGLEDTLGPVSSVTDFSLPPFIQDYGPGPSEFDPEPEDEFDMVMRDIMKDVDVGTWNE